jgi:hypothetical protein
MNSPNRLQRIEAFIVNAQLTASRIAAARGDYFPFLKPIRF